MGKKLRGTLLAALLTLAGGWSPGMTADDLDCLPGLNRMVWMRVPPAKATPTIDGKLDLEHGEWADAVCVAGFLAQRPGLLLPIPCRTYLSWDREHFYLGIRTGILPGGRLVRRERRNEGQVHNDDAIELYFDPLGRDQPERAHYQVILNSLGYCLDSMITAGVNALFWNSGWDLKTDYQPGMDHWDAEIAIPVKSMSIQSPNASGQAWRFLVCRDWRALQDAATNEKIWRIYSSITGWGAFPYPDSYAGLVLDDAAPAVQLLDLAPLWQGKLGFTARLSNPTGKPIECLATAKAFFQYQEKGDTAGTRVDWLARPNPLREATKAITLKPGGETTWTLPAADLPPLPDKGPQWYDLVFAVTERPPEGSNTFGRVPRTFFRAQRHFKKLEYKTYVEPYELPLRVAYNPVRDNLWLWCDVLDDPSRDKARGVLVELYDIGKEPGKDGPLVARKVTSQRHGLVEGLIEVPPLKKVGQYPVRATLVGEGDASLATKLLTIEKLDEAKEFAWWNCRAGLSDKPVPPHKPLECNAAPGAAGSQPIVVKTTMGEVTFAGSPLPAQIRMTGEDLLAGPVRLTCAVGGRPVVFKPLAGPRTPGVFLDKRSGFEVDLASAVAADPLAAALINHMEYDGCMRIHLIVGRMHPEMREVRVDYLRLEIPVKPERAEWLWTMAQDCRASWLAVDLSQGKGVVWDSRDRTGFQMAVGTFMPQYVVSDSFRGLCWFADNDRGWVPRDDVPATEVIRGAGETVLRLNLIGKPFALRSQREIVFNLLGLPGRPLPKGWRLYHRNASNFGHYVGDPVVNYSAPMPADFAKAQAFMAEGALYEKDGSRKKQPSGRWYRDFEFAPWHDTHHWFKTPDVNPKTFSYFQLECGDGAFTPTSLDYRCYLWNEYVRRTDLAGVYFDTPEAMGFSFNLSNGVAYIIPEGQPGAGQVQPGYTISGFREYLKRVRTIFAQHGRDNPWLEMHATHGPVAPCTPFLDLRTDGEHHRTPSSRHFMAAWPPRHFRAINIPPLYGLVTRWLGGYPWDGRTPDADPLRCKIATLLLHDIFTGWGDFDQSTSVYHDQAPTTRGPLLGFKRPNITQKLIAHGMNRDEVVYHPYWQVARLSEAGAIPPRRGWLQVVRPAGAEGEGLIEMADRDGKPVEGLRASLWTIPSQEKAIVVIANYGERPVQGVIIRLETKRLGLTPRGNGERLLVADFETGEPLAETPALDFFPLDFWLLLVARVKVAPDSPAARIRIEPAKDRGGKPVLSAECIRTDLLAHGFLGPDAKHYGPDQLDGLAAVPDGLRAELFHVPSRCKVLLALTNETAKPRAAVTIALAVDKLGLVPRESGENLLVLDVRTGDVLQETTHISRGRVFVRPGRYLELGKVAVSIPPGDTALLLVAKP